MSCSLSNVSAACLWDVSTSWGGLALLFWLSQEYSKPKYNDNNKMVAYLGRKKWQYQEEENATTWAQSDFKIIFVRFQRLE